MTRWCAAVLILAGTYGCSVKVASLTLAAADRPSTEIVRSASPRGRREGRSCRIWLLGVPFGLPQVDEAIRDALRPVHGAFLRNVTVFSEHPIYVFFGWHCYRVRGEAFG